MYDRIVIHATEAPGDDRAVLDMAPARVLSPLLETLARTYIAARRRNGDSLLAMAAALALARQQAQHGEWGVWLAATQTNERAARRMIAIHERAEDDPAFAEAVRNNWFNATVAALVAESDDEQLLMRLLALPAPPTVAQAKSGIMSDLLPDRAALIARAATFGVIAEDQGDEGVLLRWPNESPDGVYPLLDADAADWLDRYGAQGPPPYAVDDAVGDGAARRPWASAPNEAPSIIVEHAQPETPPDLRSAGVALMHLVDGGAKAVGYNGAMNNWSSGPVATAEAAIAAARNEMQRRITRSVATHPAVEEAAPAPRRAATQRITDMPRDMDRALGKAGWNWLHATEIDGVWLHHIMNLHDRSERRDLPLAGLEALLSAPATQPPAYDEDPAVDEERERQDAETSSAHKEPPAMQPQDAPVNAAPTAQRHFRIPMPPENRYQQQAFTLFSDAVDDAHQALAGGLPAPGVRAVHAMLAVFASPLSAQYRVIIAPALAALETAAAALAALDKAELDALDQAPALIEEAAA